MANSVGIIGQSCTDLTDMVRRLMRVGSRLSKKKLTINFNEGTYK